MSFLHNFTKESYAKREIAKAGEEYVGKELEALIHNESFRNDFVSEYEKKDASKKHKILNIASYVAPIVGSHYRKGHQHMGTLSDIIQTYDVESNSVLIVDRPDADYVVKTTLSEIGVDRYEATGTDITKHAVGTSIGYIFDIGMFLAGGGVIGKLATSVLGTAAGATASQVTNSILGKGAGYIIAKGIGAPIGRGTRFLNQEIAQNSGNTAVRIVGDFFEGATYGLMTTGLSGAMYGASAVAGGLATASMFGARKVINTQEYKSEGFKRELLTAIGLGLDVMLGLNSAHGIYSQASHLLVKQNSPEVSRVQIANARGSSPGTENRGLKNHAARNFAQVGEGINVDKHSDGSLWISTNGKVHDVLAETMGHNYSPNSHDLTLGGIGLAIVLDTDGDGKTVESGSLSDYGHVTYDPGDTIIFSRFNLDDFQTYGELNAHISHSQIPTHFEGLMTVLPFVNSNYDGKGFTDTWLGVDTQINGQPQGVIVTHDLNPSIAEGNPGARLAFDLGMKYNPMISTSDVFGTEGVPHIIRAGSLNYDYTHGQMIDPTPVIASLPASSTTPVESPAFGTSWTPDMISSAVDGFFNAFGIDTTTTTVDDTLVSSLTDLLIPATTVSSTAIDRISSDSVINLNGKDYGTWWSAEGNNTFHLGDTVGGLTHDLSSILSHPGNPFEKEYASAIEHYVSPTFNHRLTNGEGLTFTHFDQHWGNKELAQYGFDLDSPVQVLINTHGDGYTSTTTTLGDVLDDSGVMHIGALGSGAFIIDACDNLALPFGGHPTPTPVPGIEIPIIKIASNDVIYDPGDTLWNHHQPDWDRVNLQVTGVDMNNFHGVGQYQEQNLNPHNIIAPIPLNQDGYFTHNILDLVPDQFEADFLAEKTGILAWEHVPGSIRAPGEHYGVFLHMDNGHLVQSAARPTDFGKEIFEPLQYTGNVNHIPFIPNIHIPQPGQPETPGHENPGPQPGNPNDPPGESPPEQQPGPSPGNLNKGPNAGTPNS